MNIEILGKFFDNQSISIINRNLAIGLSKDSTLKIKIIPVDSVDSSSKVSIDILSKLKKLQKVEMDKVDIQIRHTYPPIWKYPLYDNTKVIFIQPWEYSKIPFEWQYKWEMFADAVITPSMWTADKYLNAGLNPKRTFVVPNGYDPEVFNNEPEESKFFDSKKFTYLFVGNHQSRKGLDILLNVWKDTFVKADNVQLYIKDSPQIYGQNNLLSQILNLQYHVPCGKILYNADPLSEKEMANLYKNAKVIVHPYRGEGFGMHVQEAVACGAYPIITSNGPTEEFIPKDIGARLSTSTKLVDITSPGLFALKPGDSVTGMGSHSWILEPDPNDLKFRLKLIYQHHERKKFLNKVKEYNNPNTWDTVIKTYSEVLKQVSQYTGVVRKTI